MTLLKIHEKISTNNLYIDRPCKPSWYFTNIRLSSRVILEPWLRKVYNEDSLCVPHVPCLRGSVLRYIRSFKWSIYMPLVSVVCEKSFRWKSSKFYRFLFSLEYKDVAVKVMAEDCENFYYKGKCTLNSCQYRCSKRWGPNATPSCVHDFACNCTVCPPPPKRQTIHML